MSQKEHSEQGVVLIVLALLVLGVVAMVGLVVDVFTLRTTRSAQNTTTAVAASASISEYQRSEDHPAERLEAAREAAERVSNVNFTFSLGKPLSVDPSSTIPVGHVNDPDPAFRRNPLSPGRWHFIPTWLPPYFDPTTHACVASGCPCENSKWKGPCFQPIDITSPALTEEEINSAINSMKLGVTLQDGTALKTMFMKTVGIPAHAVSTNATIAAKPLRVVFLVDLSRPAVWESHLPYEVVGAGVLPNYAPAEYAFKLTNKTCAANDSPYLTFRGQTGYSTANLTCQTTVSSCTGVTGSPPATNCVFAGGWFTGLNSAIFNQACPKPMLIPFRTISTHPALLHAREEFRCFPVSYKIGSGAMQNAAYLVDAYRGDTKDKRPYTGPEPLNSMLNGVRTGLEIVEDRRLKTDLAAVIGFDQINDINIRKFPLSNYDTPEFFEMLQLVSSNEDRVRRNSGHMFFPREDAHSNLQGALVEASRLLLAQPDYPASDNHVILLTPGIASCHTDSNGNSVCSMDNASVRDGIDDAVNVVNSQFIPNGLRLSVILIGNLVKPHEVLRKGPPAHGCMNATDMQEANVASTSFERDTPDTSDTWLQDSLQTGTVSGGALSFSTPYYYPNKLAAAAVASGGMWAPVRPACAPTNAQLANGKTCAAGGLTDYLNSRCQTLSASADPLLNEPGLTDSKGRLACDSQCRTRTDQIQQYVAAALSKLKVITVNTSQEQ